jgi:hypothetical protein
MIFRQFILLALTLVGFLPMAFADMGGEEGGWISGGGDQLRIHFEEGRIYAREVVGSVVLEPGKIVTPEIAEWFAKNKAALAADLNASPHEWHENEQTTCAFTEYRSNAPVKLSFDSCRSVSSSVEAAKVLVHESVHHLGEADHAFADKVAVQIVASWEKQKLARVAFCPEATPPLVKNMLGKWRMDPLLGKMLSGSADRPIFSEIELVENRSILKQFDEFRSFHGGCALSAGTIRWKPARGGAERSVPYFIRRNGLHLFLITFRSEDDLVRKKLSARLVQFVKSEKRGKDRLVITARPLQGGRPLRGPVPARGFEMETFQRVE